MGKIMQFGLIVFFVLFAVLLFAFRSVQLKNEFQGDLLTAGDSTCCLPNFSFFFRDTTAESLHVYMYDFSIEHDNFPDEEGQKRSKLKTDFTYRGNRIPDSLTNCFKKFVLEDEQYGEYYGCYKIQLNTDTNLFIVRHVNLSGPHRINFNYGFVCVKAEIFKMILLSGDTGEEDYFEESESWVMPATAQKQAEILLRRNITEYYLSSEIKYADHEKINFRNK
jgi:hypothetical protein